MAKIKIEIKAKDKATPAIIKMILGLYKTNFGYRRFFMQDWWRVKLGFKSRKLCSNYSSARLALEQYRKEFLNG